MKLSDLNQRHNPKILIVEDDLDIQDVLRLVIEGQGYDVEVLSNGSEVQKTVKRIKPGMIFLDIWMPGGDGRELTKLLKSQKATSSIPIVLVSALTNLREVAESVGADDYLPKPFSIDQITQKVNKYCPLISSERQTESIFEYELGLL